MSLTISLTESQALNALRYFLTQLLPSTVEVVKAQTNRTSEPKSADFVTMTPLMRERLETNTKASADALFMGSIAGNTLTISSVTYGAINVGSPVFGVGIPPGVVVTALGTGSGGVGTYTVSGAPLTIGSEKIAAGITTLLSPAKLTIQLDVHGPNAGDNAALIAASFRDQYAIDQFQAAVSPAMDVTPLYCSDAHQMPFVNGQQQVENRWVVDAVMQVNPVLSIPQQYADALSVTLAEVDATYPPQ